MCDVRAAAAEYREKGVGICRIRPGEKRPTAGGWTERSAEPDEFQPGDGVGLLGGWLSDGNEKGRFLVCVDLDSPEANAKADDFLPTTEAVEGRAGKPRSHRWYFVRNVPDWATSKASGAVAAAESAGFPPGPFKKQFRRADGGGTVIDFLGTGGQAAAPPSVHDSGEVREWHDGGGIEKAATVDFEFLWDAVCKLAQAAGARVPEVGKAKETVPRKERLAKSDKVASKLAGPIQGIGTRECDVPMAERVKRCRRYLPEVDLAVSGEGGHDKTYRVARLIANDFAIDDRETALELLTFYNERLRLNGQETWTQAGIERKLDDALKAPDDPERPYGCKLATKDDVPRAWDDPARLAGGFLRERHVRFLKQTAFEYEDGAYRVVSAEWLAARVREYAERAADTEYRRLSGCLDEQRASLRARIDAPAPNPDDPTFQSWAADRRAAQKELGRLDRQPTRVAPKVTEATVGNTIGAIAVRAQLPDATELDSWVGGSCGVPRLVVANGLLDPVGRTLVSHSPAWFSVTRLPVAFDDGAAEPAKWLAFITEVLEGDAERIAVIQEVFGACLDRGTPAKWFAALVGSGDNGKSVALVVLRALLGGANCSAVNVEELSQNRFASFALFGKLANVVGDQGHFESSDEGWLKRLTGGDLVTFEQKGRDPIAMVNRAKLIFAANTMPTFADKSEATWNRLVAVPFEYTVPRDRKNPAMLTEAYWADELPGILNWALDGLARLRAQSGFTRSEKCDALKRETRTDSNPARRFLAEEYEWTGDEADRVTVAELYAAYKSWCAESGFNRPLTKPKFGKEVRSAFPALGDSRVVKIDDSSCRAWVGVRRILVTAA